MATLRDSSAIFDNLITKFSNLLYARTEGDSILINKTLDELNNLNYKHSIITNTTKAVLLVNQCCSLIYPDDSILVSKCCQLITNLVTYQHLKLEGKTLKLSTEWCFQALKLVEESVLCHVLVTIDALLRIDPQNTQIRFKVMLTNNCPIMQFAQDRNKEELAVLATQCLEACTVVVTDDSRRFDDLIYQLNICATIFISYLVNEKYFKDLLHHKMLISCLRGVNNIVIQDVSFLDNHLGILLGIIRSYMLYGVKGVDFIKPKKLLPSQLSIPESTVNTLREKKGGKVTKLRKTKAKPDANKLDKCFECRLEDSHKEYVPATADKDPWNNSNSDSMFTILKTSDSEFSDNESAATAKLIYLQRKIRQASLNLLLKISKSIEKRTMFSYWSSFIPDGSPAGTHSICTSILKDPSPSTRSIALNVLLTLLSSSKLYLSQAESSKRSAAFTPFSETLGSMILEMHRCLRFALNENSIPVLIQVLRCLAELVQASPYHRLTPGIITKIVRSVKVFLDHKDTTVQVRSLVVVGCILASEPPVPETKVILLRCSSNKDKLLEYTSGSASESKVCNEDIEYANFSTDEEDNEQESVRTITDVPWVLRVCLRNLGVAINSAGDCVASTYSFQTPAKLESLQVISAMARNYFTTLIAPYLLHIAKGLETTLLYTSDKYIDLRLLAGSALDSIGQAMSLYFTNNPDRIFLAVDEGLAFWNTILSGPLLSLIDNEEHSVIKAVACDCLGSIGADIFERLAKDKQLLVITSLLGCSRDEEGNVRGAAVRALAISVLYPSLREDSGFVIDTAETIYKSLQDRSLTVKAKASWSLANLTSALVLNKNNPNVLEDIPEKLIIDLIKISIKGCKDNDKVKANTVRALGDLLQLLSEEQMTKGEFKEICMEGITSLITCSSVGSNMKVRWNACHSLGKVLKNDVIYVEAQNWQNLMFHSLMNLVVGFKNFKVRISAALALSCISKKAFFGEYYFPSWKALLRALENSENMEDFTEYKHRDNLVDQVCLSIGHLATFLLPTDLHTIQDDVAFFYELLKCNVRKVQDRVVPEKASCLTSAEMHLKSLLSTGVHGEQKEVLSLLIDIFNSDIL